MPQVSAAVLRSTPSSTSASASIRRAAAPSFSPLAALRSSDAVKSRRVIDTAAPIDAAPLKSQHRVRISLIWESLTRHSFGPLGLLRQRTTPSPHSEELACARLEGRGRRRGLMVLQAMRSIVLRLAEPVIGPRFARTRWRLLTMRVFFAWWDQLVL